MRTIRIFTTITIAIVMCLSVPPHYAKAATIADDLATICGWYESLASDDKYKHFTAEDKFKFVFNPKIQMEIHYASMRMYYSALRTTEARQRYDLMQAYASGTLGKDWHCPPMQAIMQEFIALDRFFQYSQQ